MSARDAVARTLDLQVEYANRAIEAAASALVQRDWHKFLDTAERVASEARELLRLSKHMEKLARE